MGGVVLNILLTLKLNSNGVPSQRIYFISKGDDIVEEIWKSIKGYEGYYEVSNMGRVRSLDRCLNGRYDNMQLKKGQIMKICYNKRVNIYEVHLIKHGNRKCFKIHRLVAEAFIYNDDTINKTVINHIDGDRSNNNVENLEWSTYSENLQHAYDILHRPINIASAKRRRCKSINKLTNSLTVYTSIMSASRNTGISETQIRRIANKECINEMYDFEIE